MKKCMQCNSGGEKNGNTKYKEYISLQKTKYKNLKCKHNKSECIFTNTHPLRKNPSFKVSSHTSEDQNHGVQYLHSVKHTKLDSIHYNKINRSKGREGWVFWLSAMLTVKLSLCVIHPLIKRPKHSFAYLCTFQNLGGWVGSPTWPYLGFAIILPISLSPLGMILRK